jgi:hypothetical protein
MDDGEWIFYIITGYQLAKWMMADDSGRLSMPSHGGNTGSNPVGDAN